MSIRIQFLIYGLFPLATLLAAPPNWTAPNAGDYAFTMSVTGAIVIDGQYSLGPNDLVAVFRDDEIRSLASGSDFSAFGFAANIYYFLTIYSNESPEDLTILVYNAEADAVYQSTTPLAFQQQGVEGSVNAPFDIVISLSSPLPVRMESFTGRAIADREIHLSWTTLSEENNRGFGVERSLNGNDFISLGFVTGGGSSSSRANYNFVDQNIRPGKQYFYRLRQEDHDDSITYSPMISLELPVSQTTAWTFFPNPLSQGQRLQLKGIPPSTDHTRLTVFDFTGRKVASVKISDYTNQQTISLPPLPAGHYLLQLSDDQTQTTHSLLID